ncbi:MAG: 50S ribosomal protein L11 methyltransferase [Armatimonadota bacterium]|nr:50S ribosomal protein L11 methyltransferase [Armatimonadota bacterium]
MTWIEVSLEVPRSAAEHAADIVLRYCPQGLAETTSGRYRVLRAYLPAGAGGRAALAGLRRELRVLPHAHVVTRPVRDERWREAWKAHARPLAIGRLRILPTWWPVQDDERRPVIRLDPGMAFGSGEHPTTQLCLAALERYTRPGSVVVDVGTGSGILAVAAARLGARRVIAVDNDSVAVDVARRNMRANRVASRVEVLPAQGLPRLRTPADLIVANLTAQTLPSVIAAARRHLRAGGWLVASGFGARFLPDVRAAMIAAGLRPVRVDALRGWRAVCGLAVPSRRPRHVAARAHRR